MPNLIEKNQKADVLIVVVTKVEKTAVLAAVKAVTKFDSKAITISDRTYRDLGIIGGSRLFLASSEMGSGGVGGSQENVRKAIEALRPSIVIMVGIAFGIDDTKQKIGDILVANQICQYELQRVGTNKIVLRADRPHTAARLISWLSEAEYDYETQSIDVQQGLIFSGDKLIDNKRLRNKLLSLAPGAIGGEMEGAGLYVACTNAKVDWILVKAICDWADGNKSENKKENQKKAANNAATFVVEALHRIPFDHTSEVLQFSPNVNSIIIEEMLAEQTVHLEEKVARLVNNSQLNTSIFPLELVDAEIKKNLKYVRSSRFFQGLSATEVALEFAAKLQTGEFSNGSKSVRSTALAWCARILVNSEHQEKSKVLLNLAATLDSNESVEIASAFTIAAEGKVAEAIAKLATIPTETAKSAAFFIQKFHHNAQTAIAWLAEAGFSIENLDPDGKVALLTSLLELERWDDLYVYSDTIQESDFEEAPVLLWLIAITTLTRSVAEEFRPPILQHIPFLAANFPLAEDDQSWIFRRKAVQIFTRFSEVARALSCCDSANTADDYALWLRLRDPLEKARALLKLEASMSAPQQALRHIPLALQFLPNIDRSAVERAISQETAFTAGKSSNAAFVRLAMLFYLETPKMMVDYITRHREQLLQHFQKNLILGIEVEVLAKAGFLQQAKLRLDEMIEDGFSGNGLQWFRNIIDNIPGQDPTEQLKSTFTESDSINDLHELVSVLKRNNDWEQAAVFSKILFDRTKTVAAAEDFSLALIHTTRFQELGTLLREFPEFWPQSETLHAYWCMVLYREGALVELAHVLEQLRLKRDNINDRRLTTELAITSGNWENLTIIAEDQWTHREQRSAQELLRAAYAAKQIGSIRAKDLMYVAAEKGKTDPNILFGAYNLATTINLEDNEDVFKWMEAAAKLSSHDGPVRQMSLRELVEMKPDWDLRSQDAMSQLIAGKMPICGAAMLLNQSLVSMMLTPSLANSLEVDPRRRRVIPAFSGMRTSAKVIGDVITIDSTVLLTLAQLDMLKKLEESFQKIFVPHSTLRWLYSENTKVLFHQPSRVKNAEKLRRFIANGNLQTFIATAPLDGDLSSEVGEDLAAFISEARAVGAENKNKNRIFTIVSQPVYQITSLMEKVVDLSAYSAQLSDCNAVLNKLIKKGQLTAAEAEYAQNYFKRQKSECPQQTELPDGAVLYLDDTVVSSLQHTNLLGKLKAAGLTGHISKSKITEADTLIEYAALTSSAESVIEKIRKFLVEGISKDRISLSPMLDDFEEDRGNSNADREMANHPTFAVFGAGRDVDSIIVDDRALNCHMMMSHIDNKITPISTTLDLLDTFLEKKMLSKIEFFEAKTKLRQACYVFIPLTVEELQYYFVHAQTDDGQLCENAELKAIRENILRIQMSDFLQLPQEATWLDGMQKIFMETLKNQWHSELKETDAIARSSWLLRQLNLLGWAHSQKDGNALTMNGVAYGSNVILLMLAGMSMPKAVRILYFSWLELALLSPLRNENHDLWIRIIGRLKELISEPENSHDEEVG